MTKTDNVDAMTDETKIKITSELAEKVKEISNISGISQDAVIYGVLSDGVKNCQNLSEEKK